MKSVDKQKPNWLKRMLLGFMGLVLLVILAVVALRFYITTESGARFIESQVNNRSFGPIERIEINGLSGDPLTTLSVDNIALYDKKGAWFRGRNLELDWQATAFSKRHLLINTLNIEKTEVLRRPNFNATEPSDPPKITLKAFEFSSIDLTRELIGQNVSLTASGGFIAEPAGDIISKIKAVRTDVIGDRLNLDFKRFRTGEMTGTFDLYIAAGNPLASLLRAPAADNITGSGQIAGTNERGSGKIAVSVGDQDALSSEAAWTAENISIDAIMNLEAWPELEDLTARIGSKLNSSVSVDRTQARAFTADLNVPGLSAIASGVLPNAGYIPAQADINIKAKNAAAFITLPDGYAVGRAEVSGAASFKPPYGFDGRASLTDIRTTHGTAKTISGPINIEQQANKTLAYTAELQASRLNPAPKLPIQLAETTTLKSTGSLDHRAGSVTLKTLNLKSGENQISSKGFISTNAKQLDISGRIIANTLPQGQLPEGIFKSDYALKKTEDSAFALTADGIFAPTTPINEPFGDLIGEQLLFQTNMNPIEGGVSISMANISGKNLKAAMTGTFGGTLDLSGEAIISAPLRVQSVSVSDGAEGRFEFTGTPDAPRLRLDATAGQVAFQDYALSNARLRADISDVSSAPKGPIQLEGDTEYGTMYASTDFASKSDVFVMDELNVTLGRLTLDGSLRYPDDNIAEGRLALRLPESDGQYARANMRLFNQSGEQNIDLSVEAKKIELAGFQIEAFKADLDGTLNSLMGNISTNGQRGSALTARRFNLNMPLNLTRTMSNAYRMTATPDLDYGQLKFLSRRPLEVTYQDGELTVQAPLIIADGTINIAYARGKRESLKIEASSLPVSILPLSDNLTGTTGRINGNLDLNADGMTVNGSSQISLTDWRGYGLDEAQGFSGKLVTDITGSNITTNLTASSPAGFETDGQMQGALVSAGELSSIRLNMDAPLSGRFTASGAAASILGLMTPSEVELGGSLSSNITISGTPNRPLVEGMASARDIKLEIPELGTRIRKGRFTANFTNDSVTVSDVYIADTNDGFIRGSGEFKLAELGRPVGSVEIQASDFQALDRRDVQAQLQGNLKFQSTPKDAALSGDMTINKAEVKEFITGSVAVVEIEVEEINKAGDAIALEVNAPAKPITLDLKVRAPRNVFVRSRGLDIELSVDADVKGSLTDPTFFGKATVLRGGYKIAGKTMDLGDGTINFNGELAEARIDFTASTETQNLDARINITGTVAAPEIEFSSTPERPEDEILSALLFGRSATELSSLEAAQLAGALAQMSGVGGGFDLLGGLRDAFGMSELSVNLGEEGSAQLIGGRYLANNVYLKVFSGAGPDQTGAIIDWEIRENIALRSRIRADNDQALSLKWKRDF